MPKQTERIKISPFIKKSLDALKTEENWSYGRVIDALLEKHDELTDPDIIAEKEKKLNDEYVEKSEYSRLYSENIDNRKKVKELTDKLEEITKELTEEIKNKDEQLATKLKEHQEGHGKLHDALTLKRNKIQVLTTENRDLNQKLDQLHFILSDTQKKYDECESDYKHFSNYIDGVYLLTDQKLKTLTRVIFFLSALMNKRRVFTLDQLTDKLIYYSVSEIEEVIPLFRYKIFPVKKYLVDGVECFGFDRHYLKR